MGLILLGLIFTVMLSRSCHRSQLPGYISSPCIFRHLFRLQVLILSVHLYLLLSLVFDFPFLFCWSVLLKATYTYTDEVYEVMTVQCRKGEIKEKMESIKARVRWMEGDEKKTRQDDEAYI